MNKILGKRQLASNVIEYEIHSPAVSKHCKPGQFIILIVDKEGERVPFTICDFDRTRQTVTILVQTVGYSTHRLSEKNVGDEIFAFVGPLGNATDLQNFNRICLIGGGIGTAVIFPQAKEQFKLGKTVDVIIGARDQSLIMYEDEFKKNSSNLHIMTDNGSYGEQGFVTTKLKTLLDSGAKFDVIFAVGPMMMMKAVSDLTKEYGIYTIVSMNSIMVDGTGMCGGCRLTVDGKTKYACVDGPEFDAHQIDFAEALNRLSLYKDKEQDAFCRLTQKK